MRAVVTGGDMQSLSCYFWQTNHCRTLRHVECAQLYIRQAKSLFVSFLQRMQLRHWLSLSTRLAARCQVCNKEL